MKPKVGNDRRGNAGKGRPKGSRNKVTADLREMIQGALSDAGGRKYLADQARSNPAAFLTLIGRILPKDVRLGDPNGDPLPVPEWHLYPTAPLPRE